MRLLNLTTGETIATNVSRADTFVRRIVGFLDRKSIASGEGLWFPDCAVIHTLGMRGRIDVIFLDPNDRVIRTTCAVPANRFIVACSGANAVIELGAGALHASDVLIGDRLALQS